MAFDVSITLPTALVYDERALRQLADGGLKFVSLPDDFFHQDRQKVRDGLKALEENQIQVDTVHPPYGGGNSDYSLCAEPENIRKATIRTYQECLERYADAHVRVIPVHTGGAINPLAGPSSLDRLTDTLEKLLPYARKTGTVLALENTFYVNPCPFADAVNPSGVEYKYLNDDSAMLREYVLKWDDPLIRICHDVGHSTLYGHTLAEDLAQFGDLTALYHIHDNDGQGDRHWNVGEGETDWTVLSETLKKNNYSLPLFDEVLRVKNEKLFSLSTPALLLYLVNQAKEIINR